MKTNEIVNLLKKKLKGLAFIIDISGPGGDHDTDNIIISFDESKEICLFICGFDDDNILKDPTDWSIPLIEIKDGTDSEGGLQYDEEDIVKAYHIIKKTFKALNYTVVNTMDDYF